MQFKHALSIILFLTASLAQAENWPSWRGPAADGTSPEKDPPISWSAKDNVTWRTPAPAGNSTPILWGDKVFITAATDRGHVRSVICFNRDDGQKLWSDDTRFDGQEPSHADNPYCSSSPATDGNRVYAWLGSAGVVAVDFTGKQLWKTELGSFNHIWGNASSPVLYRESVILNCGPGTNCFLTALDKQTGKVIWKQELPEAVSKTPGEYKGSWSTPVLADIGGATQMLVDLPGCIASFDPATGKELWRCTGLGPLAYSNPIVGKEVIVAMAGYGGAAIGLRKPAATDRGDLTASHRLWQINDRRQIPQRIGSGIVIGDRLYTLEEPGTAKCIEMATGHEIWHAKAIGSSWSSTELVDGKLFSTDQSGDTIVWLPGDKLEPVSHNAMGEKMRASLVFSDGQVFIRTYEALYCVGKRKPLSSR